jgi:DNA gyrase subunit A
MIITQLGNTLRIPVSGLRLMGRATQGVRLINLKENDSIGSVARVSVDEEDNDDIEKYAEENIPVKDENGKEFED